MSKVTHIFTKLPHTSANEVELDTSKARASDSNKKFDYHIIGYDVYSVNKRNRDIKLLGNIKYVGSKINSKVKLAANDYELVILDGPKIWFRDDNDDIYLFNNMDDFG